MCLKTDTILLEYTFYQLQNSITTYLSTVEIYQETFQQNSFDKNDLMNIDNFITHFLSHAGIRKKNND